MSQNLTSQLRLNIVTLKALGYRLGLSPEAIATASLTSGRDYSPFTRVSKRPPFAKNLSSPKRRRIDNPVALTKEVQKRIYRRLLRDLPLPDHICGGVKGKTILDNINPHLRAHVIVTLDIKSFFPHITTYHVYRVWNQVLGCSPEIASLLTRLTTFERRLPQGAPTSSALANLVLLSLDEPIRAFCRKHRIVYTTWIDDLVFSGDESRRVIDIAVSALRAGGFSLPHKKLKIMTSGGRMLVTGVVLGHKPGILRRYIRDTRAGIHRLAMGDVSRIQIDDYSKRIIGRIAHIKRINPTAAWGLKRQVASVILGK